MKAPEKPKYVMSLNEKVATLNRFISKSTDKCISFFDQVKKGKNFKWTEECQTAFEKLKVHLATSLILSKPIVEKDLFVYLAVTDQALNAAIVRDEDGIQRSVHHIRKRLSDAKLNYSLIEKLVYNLLLTTRKLRPNFQDHPIKVLTNQPLRQILHKLKTS